MAFVDHYPRALDASSKDPPLCRMYAQTSTVPFKVSITTTIRTAKRCCKRG